MSDKEAVTWLQSNPTQIQSLLSRVKVIASVQAVAKVFEVFLYDLLLVVAYVGMYYDVIWIGLR